MKMQVTASVLGLTLLTSCLNFSDRKGARDELQPVTINGEYDIAIPTYMKKTTTLNDEASLQFQNIFKETYVIVIDENKADFVKTYRDLDLYVDSLSVTRNYASIQVLSTTSNLEVISQTDITYFEINGQEAASTEIDGRIEGVSAPITYFITFVEGKAKLYMIMAWTLQDRKDRYRPTFEEVARSFRVIR